MSENDRDLLVAAAWLHDIGYAPELRDTGFHPLDGARHLEALGAPARAWYGWSPITRGRCTKLSSEDYRQSWLPMTGKTPQFWTR